jgi:PKD repeat protein
MFASTASAAPPTVSYHWSFGDGTAADGPSVEHVYAAGAFTATLTATGASGETAIKAYRITALALTLRGRTVTGYRGHIRFRGHLAPALRGVRVGVYGPDGRRAASGLTRRGGAFRIGVPVTKAGAYVARYGPAASAPVTVRVRPRIALAFSGSGVVGRPLRLAVHVRPAAAGTVHLDIRRNGEPWLVRNAAAGSVFRLSSRRPAAYRIVAATAASSSYAASRVSVQKLVFFPRLAVGADGPSVLALNRELDRIHIALGAVDSSFGLDTRDAVIAFQKLRGLPRTGSVDGRLWRLLLAARPPRARYPYGNHIEVSKTLQVLFVVRSGRVVLVSHVSTGATGNTPAGRWHVYSKAPGYLASGMFDSSFFLRGFALHGYHSVPFYAASHGCVRIPIWLAPRIYSLAPYGSIVDVY